MHEVKQSDYVFPGARVNRPLSNMAFLTGPTPHESPRLDKRIYTLYIKTMIKSFRHKGLEDFFKSGSKAGIQPAHAKRLQLQLGKLDTAKTPEDMGLPGWKLHPVTSRDIGQCRSAAIGA